ncbi:MAG: Crp/Fnr family transcriptional regulator [Fulvivirga sp.]|nr:Crp/Fnr family transcriptional regulator [Fulvivirga sp.]
MKAPVCTHCENENKLFCQLSQLELEGFSQHKKFLHFNKGEPIYTAGKRAHGLYCIYRGKVKTAISGGNGRDVITRLYNVGEVFGYDPLLSETCHHSSAIALEETFVCKISGKKFLSTLKNNSDLSSKIMYLLVKDLKNSERNIVLQAHIPVRKKLASTLIRLHKKYGFENDGKTLSVKLTRREIAEMAGTTTESSIRGLNRLANEEFIILKGKKIIIPSLKALLDLATTH